MFRTEGYVPTCYSPVCRSPCGALDLHVLGLPPAFALSQDQTLKLERTSPGRSQRLTRSVTLVRARTSVRAICTAPAPAAFHDKGVDLKRRPPKSRPAASLGELLLRAKAARKDSAVHVSLSSDSPVKQHGNRGGSRPPVSRRTVEASSVRPESEAIVPLKVRSFRDASSRRNADGAPYPSYIGFGGPECQHR